MIYLEIWRTKLVLFRFQVVGPDNDAFINDITIWEHGKKKKINDAARNAFLIKYAMEIFHFTWKIPLNRIHGNSLMPTYSETNDFEAFIEKSESMNNMLKYVLISKRFDKRTRVECVRRRGRRMEMKRCIKLYDISTSTSIE